MKIELKKFGTMLISRQFGKEAYSAFLPNLQDLSKNETIEIDFNGVITFSPSWGDEFITPLFTTYGERLILLMTNNSSVEATLNFLAEINKMKFRRG